MSFADFQEQKQVTEVLQRSLARSRLAHAYLFTGSDLTELENVARTLSKTLNCETPPSRNDQGLPLDSCDHCPSCRRIEEANHPDVLWIRPESKSRIISVDQMRDLMQTINLKPTVSAYKVAVIVAVDRLNVQAANAFLKTLEEPPPKSILILLTVEPQRILETILSRCLRLNFSGERKQSAAEIEWLASFADMAVQTKGGLVGRYRLLGVLMKKLAEQKAEIETTLTARSPLEKYDDLDAKLRDKFEDELNAAVEAEYRRQRADLLLIVQWWMRDVLCRSLDLSSTLLNFPQMSTASDAIAKRMSSVEAMENLKVLEQTQRLLGSNVQEALALEVGLLKLKL